MSAEEAQAGETGPEDARLVGLAIGGDVDALEALLSAHGPRVEGRLSIQPRLQRLIDSSDVMQVSYLEAFLRIRSLRGSTTREFEAWLERIAQHNLTDAIRALGRDKRPEARARVTRGSAENTAITFLDRIARETRSVTRVASEAESAELLRESLGQLPESYRAVIEACDLEERSVADVAEEWERSTGAIHMLRARAHDRLRDILPSWAEEDPKSA